MLPCVLALSLSSLPFVLHRAPLYFKMLSPITCFLMLAWFSLLPREGEAVVLFLEIDIVGVGNRFSRTESNRFKTVQFLSLLADKVSHFQRELKPSHAPPF